MSDFDSKLPIRSLAVDNTTEIADSAGTTINPAKEDGNLASIKTNTDNLDVALSTRASEATVASIDANIDVALSTRASEATLSSIDGKLNSLGQKPMASSVPVVIASDQSPLPVTFDSVTDEDPNFNTVAAVAAGASSTHTFTPGSTVLLDQIDASASGQMKIEIQWGLTGSETTKDVKFTSKGDLNAVFNIKNGVAIAPTMSVKVIRTNMDNQAMDVYSTISVH